MRWTMAVVGSDQGLMIVSRMLGRGEKDKSLR